MGDHGTLLKQGRIRDIVVFLSPSSFLLPLLTKLLFDHRLPVPNNV